MKRAHEDSLPCPSSTFLEPSFTGFLEGDTPFLGFPSFIRTPSYPYWLAEQFLTLEYCQGTEPPLYRKSSLFFLCAPIMPRADLQPRALDDVMPRLISVPPSSAKL